MALLYIKTDKQKFNFNLCITSIMFLIHNSSKWIISNFQIFVCREAFATALIIFVASL